MSLDEICIHYDYLNKLFSALVSLLSWVSSVNNDHKWINVIIYKPRLFIWSTLRPKYFVYIPECNQYQAFYFWMTLHYQETMLIKMYTFMIFERIIYLRWTFETLFYAFYEMLTFPCHDLTSCVDMLILCWELLKWKRKSFM